MSEHTPWNSQPLSAFADQYARGTFIDLDNLSTHYYKVGSGPPVILIHGFFFDGHMWDLNIEALAQAHTVYVLDLWGFGYSTREPLDYGYALYAKQLLAFMDALGLEKASLIGQSMGGGTIIKFATRHQHRIHKIVLVNAAGMPNPLPILGKIANLPGVGEFMYGLRGSFFRKLVLRQNFIHNPDILSAALVETLTRFHKVEGSSEVMLSILRKEFFDTLSEEIETVARMNLPVLIVWGNQETSIALPIGQALHRALEGSQFISLDQAGHCSNIDQAEQFNQAVLAFLESEHP